MRGARGGAPHPPTPPGVTPTRNRVPGGHTQPSAGPPQVPAGSAGWQRRRQEPGACSSPGGQRGPGGHGAGAQRHDPPVHTLRGGQGGRDPRPHENLGGVSPPPSPEPKSTQAPIPSTLRAPPIAVPQTPAPHFAESLHPHCHLPTPKSQRPPPHPMPQEPHPTETPNRGSPSAPGVPGPRRCPHGGTRDKSPPVPRGVTPGWRGFHHVSPSPPHSARVPPVLWVTLQPPKPPRDPQIPPGRTRPGSRGGCGRRGGTGGHRGDTGRRQGGHTDPPGPAAAPRGSDSRGHRGCPEGDSHCRWGALSRNGRTDPHSPGTAAPRDTARLGGHGGGHWGGRHHLIPSPCHPIPSH